MAAPLLPLLLFILLLTTLFLLKILKNHQRKQLKSNHPPGPRKLPVLGNLHQLRKPLHLTLSCLSKQHGPLMFLQLGCHPALVISSAEMAEQFLKIHDLDCSNRAHKTFFQKLSYGGNDIVFSPYGEQWRELRKIGTQELFSIKKVSSFQTLQEEEIEMLISSISDLVAVNLTELTISLANKVVTKMAFGESYNHKDGRLHDILCGFERFTSSFYFADYLPQFGWVDVVRGLQAKVDRYCNELDVFFEEVIGEHLDVKRKNGEPKSECILDMMLDMLNDPTKKITMNNIKGIILDIFLGGTDTTSTVVEWAMTELIRNPEIMKHVQDEVRSVVGGKGKVQKTDIQHLHYFKMILKETLRLHPPAPLLVEKEVISGFNVDEYDIHPKTRLIINAWAIGREATYWERPEEFFPDRFMNSPIDTNGRNFHLIPFGAGRRICPGMNMGMAMVEITLANLLYAFNWDPLHGMTEEDIDLDETLGIVMRKKNPLIVMASKYTMMQE